MNEAERQKLLNRSFELYDNSTDARFEGMRNYPKRVGLYRKHVDLGKEYEQKVKYYGRFQKMFNVEIAQQKQKVESRFLGLISRTIANNPTRCAGIKHSYNRWRSGYPQMMEFDRIFSGNINAMTATNELPQITRKMARMTQHMSQLTRSMSQLDASVSQFTSSFGLNSSTSRLNASTSRLNTSTSRLNRSQNSGMSIMRTNLSLPTLSREGTQTSSNEMRPKSPLSKSVGHVPNTIFSKLPLQTPRGVDKLKYTRKFTQTYPRRPEYRRKSRSNVSPNVTGKDRQSHMHRGEVVA